MTTTEVRQSSTALAPSPSGRILVSIHRTGEAYVFSPSDVLRLRREHSIIGLLSGSLPLLPQQNSYLGLPLQLLPEEVGLLLQRDACVLIDEDAEAEGGVQSRLTKAMWEDWQAERDQEIQQMKKEAWESGRESRKKFEEAFQAGSSEVKAGSSKEASRDKKTAAIRAAEEKRRARREERKRRQAEAAEQDSTSDDDEDRQETSARLADDDEPKAPPSEATRNTPSPEGFSTAEAVPDLSAQTYPHVTHDSSSAFPWSRLPTTSPPHLVSRFLSSPPSTPQAIFTHLNSRGFYLSSGLRFGGDFVVYPGDPFRYHSHYTLSIPQSDRSAISAGKLIADGRLGTAVKKVHLIGTRRSAAAAAERAGQELKAEEKGQEGALSFYSLTWAGFGT